MLLIRYIFYVGIYVAAAETPTMTSSTNDPDDPLNDNSRMDDSSSVDDLSITDYEEYVVQNPKTFKIKCTMPLSRLEISRWILLMKVIVSFTSLKSDFASGTTGLLVLVEFCCWLLL